MVASDLELSALSFPELVIGIAGPIGVDLDQIASSLKTALASVSYSSELVKLTSEMERFPVGSDLLPEINRWTGGDTFNTYMRKMSQANALRKQNDDPAILARIAVDAIQMRREQHTGDSHQVRTAHGYIVRQLKRPEEVALLRKVYGKQFVLISAYAPERLRKEKLCDRLRRELSTAVAPSDIAHRAEQLIERDASEDGEALGQQLRDTFHLADVFIDGINKQEMDSKITRFIDALFGRNDISPSKDEYGMYAAKSASLRSADLSRQVGAALFSSDGEMVTQGCNEVPKALGGTYWDLEKPDHRDITKKQDPNEFHKREILREVVEKLRARGFLSPALTNVGSDTEIVASLIAKQLGDEPAGALRNARIGQTEIAAYVLEGETRVLSQRGVQTGIGMSTSGGSGGAHRLAQFIEGLAQKGVDCKDLAVRIRNPILFRPMPGGKLAYGYEATILADICDAVLSARRLPGALLTQQAHIADQCELLVRGFARVGIIALVDEATGYQYARKSRDLAQILEAFIAKELQPWVKTFPDDYYAQLFRLRGLDYPKDTVKRPQYFGTLTNDIVYKRLAPGVLSELKKVIPKNEKGRRKGALSQGLTRNIG